MENITNYCDILIKHKHDFPYMAVRLLALEISTHLCSILSIIWKAEANYRQRVACEEVEEEVYHS